jgi:hypothetical protein
LSTTLLTGMAGISLQMQWMTSDFTVAWQYSQREQ